MKRTCVLIAQVLFYFGEVISVTIIGLLVKQVKRITVERLSLPLIKRINI